MRTSSSRANANVARLLPILILAGFAIFMKIMGQRRNTQSRDGRTWRPRARSGARRRDDAKYEGPITVSSADIAGLRDAYSGATLDAARPMVQCATCRAFYHSDSVAILVRENAGRCASCGGTAFHAVAIAHD
jgi:hypothetical protein